MREYVVRHKDNLPRGINRRCAKCERFFAIPDFAALEKQFKPLPELCSQCRMNETWEKVQQSLRKEVTKNDEN